MLPMSRSPRRQDSQTAQQASNTRKAVTIFKYTHAKARWRTQNCSSRRTLTCARAARSEVEWSDVSSARCSSTCTGGGRAGTTTPILPFFKAVGTAERRGRPGPTAVSAGRLRPQSPGAATTQSTRNPGSGSNAAARAHGGCASEPPLDGPLEGVWGAAPEAPQNSFPRLQQRMLLRTIATATLAYAAYMVWARPCEKLCACKIEQFAGLYLVGGAAVALNNMPTAGGKEV